MQEMPPQQPPAQPPDYQSVGPPPPFQPAPTQPVDMSGVGATQPIQQQPSAGSAQWFTFSQLRGHPLINISTGEKVGEVGDILLDPRRRMIQAFATKVSVMRLHGPTYVSATNAKIGADAITFQPGGLAQQDEAMLRALPKVSDLLGIRVLTNTGQFLGTVGDVRFDQESGMLLAFEIKPEGGGLKQRLFGSKTSVLPAEGVISFGPDTVVADVNAVSGRQ